MDVVQQIRSRKVQGEFKDCHHWKKAVAILKDAITKKRQVDYRISERCMQGVFRKIRVQEIKNGSVTK